MDYSASYSGYPHFLPMKQILEYLFSSKFLFGKLILMCIYVLTYDYMYENFIYKLFGYLGDVDYEPMGIMKKMVWLLLSTLPVVEYNGLKKISSFFSLFIYLFVYIPFIHAMYVAYGIDTIQLGSYTLIMFVFILFYFKLGNGWSPIKDLEICPQIPFRAIEITTILLTIMFVAAVRDRMQFVNIFTNQSLLYELREQNSESGVLGGIAYIQGWLFGAFYPYLLVVYLRQKHWIKSLFPLAGYMLLFMADMQKMTFVMPFALMLLYYVIKINEEKISNYLHSYIVVCLTIFSIIVYIFQEDQLVFTLASFLLLRTVCVAGWLTQLYIHFFNENPYTYYSHINAVNFLTNSYPYNEVLGRAVARGSQNANANFFLTDGVAAAGLVGIFFIGLLFLGILILINSISARYKRTDIFIIFMPTMAFFLNTSIFTTLLSNGLLVLIIIIACAESFYNKQANIS
jgi:hypothetical protein